MHFDMFYVSYNVFGAVSYYSSDTIQSSQGAYLIQPSKFNEDGPLLVYLPGTDGTGNAIAPQLPGLVEAGFDVRYDM